MTEKIKLVKCSLLVEVWIVESTDPADVRQNLQEYLDTEAKLWTDLDVEGMSPEDAGLMLDDIFADGGKGPKVTLCQQQN